MMSARRPLVVLMAIMALLWQSFVVQTHRHHPDFSSRPVQLHGQVGAVPVARGDPLKHRTTPCPICDEIVQAAHYLPAAPAAFVAATIVAAWLTALPVAGTATRLFPHGWRSRAPPTLLCA